MSRCESGREGRSKTLLSGACLLSAAIAFFGCSEGDPKIPTVVEEKGSGRLFLADGRPAANARVQVFKVGAIPQPADLAKRAQAADPVLVTRTDAEGRYQVGAIENGEYNILASLDDEYAYQDSLALGGTAGAIPADTLEDPGVVRGKVALEPQHNPRTVMVQLLGTHRFANVDSAGRFEFRDLAGGAYSVRVFTSEAEYTPTFSAFRAVAGLEIDLEETLRPIFTGISAVHGLTVIYDTAAGVAHLRWNRTRHALIQDYLLYREAGRNTIALAPPFTSTEDTVFADSLWERAPGFAQGRFDYDDSTEKPFTWRVRPRLKTQAIGPFLHAVSLTTLSPKWVHTQASLRLAGPHADAATVRDTVPLVLSFLNPLRKITRIRWHDDPKDPPLRESHPNLTAGTDTLVFRSGATAGQPILIARLTDQAGSTTEHRITLRIYDDEPVVSAASAGGLPAVGDTIRIGGSATDLGRIVKWEWSIGNGPFLPVSRPETTLTIDRYPDKGLLKTVLRATDEDGNTGIKESFVEVNSWKTLKRMPHPRFDFTATVMEGRIYLIGGAGLAVDIYDPASDTWETRVSMKRERIGHQAAVFGDEIMLVGGRDDSRTIRTCEFYDVKTDTWREGPDLNRGRAYLGLSRHGSQLFAFEGEESGWCCQQSAERYDSATNAWTLVNISGMAGRSRFSSAMVGDKTYAFGGTGPNSWTSLRVYDFTKLSESPLQYGQTSIWRATAAHGKHVLFAGGQSIDKATSFVRYDRFEAYNTETRNQVSLGSLNTPRQRATLVVVDGKAYLFGGMEPGTSEVKLDVAQVYLPPLDSVLAP